MVKVRIKTRDGDTYQGEVAAAELKINGLALNFADIIQIVFNYDLHENDVAVGQVVLPDARISFRLKKRFWSRHYKGNLSGFIDLRVASLNKVYRLDSGNIESIDWLN
jgi:hypothetical protein